MNAHERVFGLYRFTPDGALLSDGVFRLRDGRVDGFEALEALFELGREAVVGFDLGSKDGVATGLGLYHKSGQVQ